MLELSGSCTPEGQASIGDGGEQIHGPALVDAAHAQPGDGDHVSNRDGLRPGAAASCQRHVAPPPARAAHHRACAGAPAASRFFGCGPAPPPGDDLPRSHSAELPGDPV